MSEEQKAPAVENLNAHKALLPMLSPGCLADIEGLDDIKAGFCRGECSKPVGPFDPLTTHLFLSTDIPVIQWKSKTENIQDFDDLSQKMKEVPQSKVTCFYRPGPDQVQLVMKYDATTSTVNIQQYSGCSGKGAELPWNLKGVVTADRSDERFVFICSHRARDDKCGYCGPILVELISKMVGERLGPSCNVHVFPCSHVGGHIYAGNVIVYSRHVGLCFGCVQPSDLPLLVDWIAGHQDATSIPASLQPKVRGMMQVKK